MRQSIFGYGLVGKAIAKHFGGFDIYDDRLEKGVDLKLLGEENIFKLQNEFDPNNSDLELISPGFPPHHPLVKRAQNPTSELDFFFDAMPKSIFISGSNGKSTTTQMCALLLKDFGAIMGGNIGIPLANMDAKAPLWVLECSSFMLHYTKLAYPEIYVLLPITSDHLSWHKSFKAYEEAKLSVLLKMGPQCFAFIPAKYHNHEFCKASLAKIYFYENEACLAKEFGIELGCLNLAPPFLQDAVLALCAAKIILADVGEKEYELLNAFKPDAHKIEEFLQEKGVLWVDDSKATNMDASLQAIFRYQKEEIFLILGGDLKGQDFADFFSKIAGLKIRLFLIGEDLNGLQILAKKHNIMHFTCKRLEIAVEKIKQILPKFLQKNTNCVVLLSPACASLDQFPSYKKRGELFKQLAKKDAF